MYWRFIDRKLRAALDDTRVVLLAGARQTGKSTLAQAIAAERGGQYVTLDDPAAAGLARADATALVRSAGDFLVIDEVQHAPQLFPALKMEVDRDRRAGRFLLTGSANVLLLPRISESLAGRIEIMTLDPLSQVELQTEANAAPPSAEASFVASLFDESEWRLATLPVDRIDICRRVLAGGFPEAVARPTGERRDAWFRSYVTSLLQRDVRDLANIEGLTDMPRLLALLAARATALLNMSEVSRACGLAHSTLRRYLALLEAAFVLRPLPAWSVNIGKRLVKAPKVHLLDAGLTAHLQGHGDPAALAASPAIGPLLETFVLQEVRHQIGTGKGSAAPYHFRSVTGQEVDIVIEGSGRRIAGLEVKAAATLARSDIAGMQTLADAAGAKFTRGAVLYLGEKQMPLADKIWAVPVSALWHRGPRRVGLARR